MERLLVAVDDSASGRFASRLVGLLAGIRRIPTTIVPIEPETERCSRRWTPAVAEQTRRLAIAAADAVEPDDAGPQAAAEPVDILARPRPEPPEVAVEREPQNGYDPLVVGAEPEGQEGPFDQQIIRLAERFEGPFATTIARGAHRRSDAGRALDILVPVTGTSYSRHGAEVALTLARADHGSVSALYARSGGRSWPVGSPAGQPARTRRRSCARLSTSAIVSGCRSGRWRGASRFQRTRSCHNCAAAGTI